MTKYDKVSTEEEEGHTPIDESLEPPEINCCTCLICSIVVLLVIGLFVSLIRYATRPDIEFNITEASITQFNITDNNTVYYNFKIGITVRNFINDVKYFDKKMDAISSYKGNQIASATMKPFVLGSKNTVMLQPIVFEGNSLIKLEHKQRVGYNKETQAGIYNLNFQLSRYVDCPTLRIPLISDVKMTPNFKVTKCSYDFRKYY